MNVLLIRVVLCCVMLCAALLLTSCAPKQQYFNVNTPLTPRISETDIIVGDGTSLALKGWMTCSPPRAIILGLHGFNDYRNAFATLGEYMQHHHIAVYAYDQRGFGISGERGIWAGEHNLIRDVSHVLGALRKQHPDTPIYVAGESMGGAVAINAAAIDALEQADGLILIAPAIWGGSHMSVLYRTPLWIGAHFAPDYRVSGGGLELLPTDNIALLRDMSLDPNIIKTTRLDAIYGLVDLMDHAYHNIAKVRMPTLTLYGAKDEIVPPFPFADYVQTLPSLPTHRFAYYPNAYHMMTRDIAADIVIDDIISWIENKSAPLPSYADDDATYWLRRDIKAH
jgi:acylglycerol lipase